MDFNKLACRVLSLLRSPKAEWPKIAAEPAEIASLYTHYILWLAAIGPIFGFIKGSLIGYGALGVHFRQGIGAGIGAAILSYLLALIVIFLMALIVEALAPTFGGQKNRVQALKAVAYGWTAAWVAAIGVVIPWVGWLIMIAGVIYSIYLLYLGLPQTMQCPHGKAAGYTAVSVIIG
ncbi:MAG: YIP1 family protein, partial [Nitrosospira sp.]|nr:YIP1 family protein [Nitrosospira sp.]